MNGTERRRDALKRIESYVCADRPKTHGDAEDNFKHAAVGIRWFFEDKPVAEFDELDIAIIHIIQKLSRLRYNRQHLDNWDDLAGYAVCGAGIVSKEKAPNPLYPISCKHCSYLNRIDAKECGMCSRPLV